MPDRPDLVDVEGVACHLAGGDGPLVVVLQEYWGVVPQICGVADRLAAEGFRVAVPDLYDGVVTDDRATASRLMSALDIARTLDRIGTLQRALAGPPDARSGCVGFCMGGGLVLAASGVGSPFAASVAFYGLVAWDGAEPTWGPSAPSLLMHFASEDGWATVDEGRRIESEATAAGQRAVLHVYDGAQHGFLDETRPESHHPQATALAWERTVDHLRRTLT